MHGLNCLFFFSSALFIHWHLVHISCLKADWLELLQRWTSNYFYFPTRKVRSEVNYFTKIRTPSWTAYCYNSWPTRKCHCLAPRSEVEQDLNRSPRQIWGGLTLTAWFFSSLSAPVPFSACQLRLCPLLSHGTALEAWEKKGKSYHFTLVCCHGNQPTVGRLRQWYARKLCGPLCQSGCSTLVFFFVFLLKGSLLSAPRPCFVSEPFAPHSGALLSRGQSALCESTDDWWQHFDVLHFICFVKML